MFDPSSFIEILIVQSFVLNTVYPRLPVAPITRVSLVLFVYNDSHLPSKHLYPRFSQQFGLCIQLSSQNKITTYTLFTWVWMPILMQVSLGEVVFASK